MANRSVFPDNIDSFIEHYDVSASDVVNIQRYKELKLKSNRTPDEEIELTNLTTILRDKLFSPEDFNKLQDCITNLETFFKNETEDYITTKQTEFQNEIDKFTYKGDYSPTTQYYKKNIVSYMGNSYIALQDTYNSEPDINGDTAYWAKVAEKGDKGDTGYGVGLNYRGDYDTAITYNVDDLVRYNASMYRCTQSTLGNSPTNTTYWEFWMSGTGENFNNLTTDDKSSLVSAINEVDANVGDVLTLTTVDKSSTVNAINEINSNQSNQTIIDNKKYNSTALETVVNNGYTQSPSVTITGSKINNLLGNQGNCDSLTGWSMDLSSLAFESNVGNYLFSLNSLKITIADVIGTANLSISSLLKPNSYYAVVGHLKNGNLSTGISIGVEIDGAGSHCAISKPTDFEIKHYKFNTSATIGTYFLSIMAQGSATEYGYFDGLMLLELTAEEYNDASWQPPNYVHGLQHLTYPSIKNHGKNLIPSFDKWNLHENVELFNPYYMQHKNNYNIEDSYVYIYLKPNTQYTFSCSMGDGDVFLKHYDRYGQLINSDSVNTTFITPSNCFKTKVLCSASNLENLILVENLQLEEGVSKTSFEPNKDEIITFPIQLSNDETLEYKNGKAVVTEIWNKNIKLDDSQDWSIDGGSTGYLIVQFPCTDSHVNDTPDDVIFGEKWDGTPLKPVNTFDAPDQILNNVAFIKISIDINESGWLNSYMPTSEEIKAFFLGWKMTDTVNKSWVAIDDASLTSSTCPTIQADLINVKNYVIHYRYKKHQTKEIQPIGKLTFSKGVNQLEIISGLIQKEKIIPFKSINSSYLINNANSIYANPKYPVNEFIHIYKNGIVDDNNWIIQNINFIRYGNEFASSANCNPISEYQIDYIVAPEMANTQIQSLTIINNGDIKDVVENNLKATSELQKDINNIYKEELNDILKSGTNGSVNKINAIQMNTDTRTTALTYDADGNLSKVEEKDGEIVVKTTNLFYDASGNLVKTEEITKEVTVVTTLNYDVNGNLTSTEKLVI